jgi:PE-PPE domain
LSGTIQSVLRLARSAGVAFLAVLIAMALALASTISSAVQLLASTALIMSGTFTPTPPPAFVDMAKNHFILPTHPAEVIDPFVAVTTPEQAWPVTGLSDLPFGRSVAIGLSDLQAAMIDHGNDNLVVFGHSQSSVISYLEKRRLAEQFPIGTPAPDIDFVTIGTLNLPNGGVMTRFWGLYLPFVDFYFNGPAPTDTQFDTDIITQRWDGFADFPIYPIILPSVLNAVLGFFYVHEEYEDVTLANDPSKYLVGTHGDTDYYFFETENLPLFGPLRSLGIPESLIDIVEPLATFIVELGYRRDIPPWVPSPAQLIPFHDPFKVVGDLFSALDETVDNTLEFLGTPPPIAIPAPVAAASMAASTVVPAEFSTHRRVVPAEETETEPVTESDEPTETESPADDDKSTASEEEAESAAEPEFTADTEEATNDEPAETGSPAADTTPNSSDDAATSKPANDSSESNSSTGSSTDGDSGA